jgi:benzoyl-CoA reductase/2-hydroxyglutaryl-CoA dehydratase subunit BcrC/BadD/HgdB
LETIVYYSRNGKKPPFEVSIVIDGQIAYINCNCELGLEKKICRHKINAIRGDKENRHSSTSDEVVARLRFLFGTTSTLRLHLEEKWRMLREFSSEHPDNEEEISNKRKLLGEAFANGFVNENADRILEPFDAEKWEESRQIYADGFKCPVTLKYVNHEGVATTRDVLVEEVFISGSAFYLLGYCNLRKQKRTFRVDRIQGLDFGRECSKSDKSLLVDVVFRGNAITLG